ncbi:hypothetical protein SAMN05216358_4203 [Rhizobium sp. AN5]|nr:hypothetical protein SAMN05216358_4203 [Rhizobium sp. AN5]
MPTGLIHNERTKLLANSLDRASTACVVAGLIAPAASIANHSTGSPQLSISTAIGTVIWLSAAVALHLLARRTLGGLT